MAEFRKELVEIVTRFYATIPNKEEAPTMGDGALLSFGGVRIPFLEAFHLYHRRISLL
jgi:hypothetical protein